MPTVLRSLRIRQWTKNLVVFAGLGFSGKAGEPQHVLAAVLAFAAFCAAASGVYLFNDVVDRHRDREHPRKRLRPVASGALPVPRALGLAAALAAAALALAAAAGGALTALALYLALQLAYSAWLKHVVLLDVFAIAAGFSLRVLGGVFAVEAVASPWLIACTVQLALFLALCKRRAEAEAIGDGDAAQRPILEEYRGPGTDMMVSVIAASTLVTYVLYCLLPAEVLGRAHLAERSRAGQPGMIWTVPFVLYGMLRYLHLVYRHAHGERPERVATMDLPMMATVAGYVAVVAVVVYS